MANHRSVHHDEMVKTLLAYDGALLQLSAIRLAADLSKLYPVSRSAAWTAVERARELHGQRVHSAA